MEEITYTYQRRGGPRPKPMFAWTEPFVIAEIAPDRDAKSAFTVRDAVETVVQNIPAMSCASTNTERTSSLDKGMCHFDGGWPNNVDVSEREGRQKHCKRVEREEGYLASCASLVKAMKPLLRLGGALDIFEVYDRFNGPSFSSGGTAAVAAAQLPAPKEPRSLSPGLTEPTETAEGASPQSSATALIMAAGSPGGSGPEKPFSVMMKFAAPQSNLQVTRICYTCGSDTEHVAVGYVQRGPEWGGGYALSSGDDAAIAAAVWHLSSCVAPAHILHSRFGGCTALTCCPKDPFGLLGGSATGMVQVWDLRKPTAATGADSSSRLMLPVNCSRRVDSHQDAVTDVKYVMSKGVDAMSCSMDGRVLFWDLRKLSEPLPEETLELFLHDKADPFDSAKSHISLEDDSSGDDGSDGAEGGASLALRNTLYTASHLDYDPMVGGVQQYLVGTAEGAVLACSRRSRIKGDRILHRYDVSQSTVFTAQRCAVLPKVFLTVGDWGWKIFGDEVPTPIMSSAPRLRQATCGKWHTTKPSIIVTGTSSGFVEMWDALQRGSLAPVEELKVADTALTQCAVHPSGRSMVTSDLDGHMYSIHIPSRLAAPIPKERAAMVATLEREYNRERAQQLVATQHQPNTKLPRDDDACGEPLTFGFVGDDDTEDESLRILTSSYLQLVGEEESAMSVGDLLQTIRKPTQETQEALAASAAAALASAGAGFRQRTASFIGSSAQDAQTGDTDDSLAARRRRKTADFTSAAYSMDGTAVFDATTELITSTADSVAADWGVHGARKPNAPSSTSKPRLNRF